MAADKDTQEDVSQDPSWLDMSDEDLLKAPVPDFSASADKQVVVDKEDNTDSTDKAGDEDDDEDKDGGAEDDKTGKTGEDEEDEAPAAAGKAGAESTKDDVTDKKEDGKDKKVDAGKEATTDDADKTKKAAPTVEVDYAAAGKELLAPFKANGREVQVNSVEDARALMQMGANYNKKMAALKPNLKVLKLLENHGLLDEGKLSFLIDLDRKDPQAINKLVKDAGLNPMDLDAEKAGDYKPKSRTVDDREVDLDNVLGDLEGSPAYARTLEIVSKQWDKASKSVIADQPMVLKVLHDHVDRGIYDLIAKEVENERTFGRLKGLSDIEAYRQVGDAIQARGGFNHLGSSQGKTSSAGEVVQPKPKKEADAQREEKRKAASGNRPAPNTPSKTLPADFNPLALDDKDFEKQSKNFFR